MNFIGVFVSDELPIYQRAINYYLGRMKSTNELSPQIKNAEAEMPQTIERNLHQEAVHEYIANLEEEGKDYWLERLLNEGEESSGLALFDLRNMFRSFQKQTCPGLRYWCGLPKRDYEDLCDICQEEREGRL